MCSSGAISDAVPVPVCPLKCLFSIGGINKTPHSTSGNPCGVPPHQASVKTSNDSLPKTLKRDLITCQVGKFVCIRTALGAPVALNPVDGTSSKRLSGSLEKIRLKPVSCCSMSERTLPASLFDEVVLWVFKPISWVICWEPYFCVWEQNTQGL